VQLDRADDRNDDEQDRPGCRGRAELARGLTLKVEADRLCTELGPDVVGTELDRSA